MPRSHLLADQAFSRAAGAPLVGGNTVLIQCDAEESYPAWLHAIAGARRWVHFECYIIHGDATGHRFADALIAKAREGVAVRVVFDWLGALGATPWTFWRRLRKAGVDVRSFNPLRFDSPLGWLSRDHRKMLAVDGTVAFVTGCRRRVRLDLGDHRCTAAAAERVTHGSVREVGDVALRVIASEPAAASVFRLDHLVTALARQRLWITDAYFVPTPPYVQALTAAANDGVDVRVLLPGGSDLMLVKPLTEAGYRTLLEGGVRIFEWDGTMVHAKTAVADGRWARVGSSNANVQSWLGNWELDVAIEDERVGARMEEIFTRDLTRSTEIVLGEGARRLERASHVPRATRARRGSRTRAARAGVLRLGHTFGAALTRRRGLGSAEAGALLYGGLLLGALAGVGLKWPRGLAWPLAIFALWLALSWLVQAAKLWKGGRSGKESGSSL
ncbi:MAG: phospholipase D-like domain-containing protein [Acidobacteria bacterium]|nr:phospholipase D-like domain-containing protein [Acidobacteriota bacterium]